MRTTILGTLLIAIFCILAVALCESKTLEHLVLDGPSDDAQQQDTYMERANYPLGFWTMHSPVLGFTILTLAPPAAASRSLIVLFDASCAP